MRKFAVVYDNTQPPIMIKAYTYKFNQGKLEFYDNKLNWITTFAPKGWLQIYEVKSNESKSTQTDPICDYEHAPNVYGQS